MTKEKCIEFGLLSYRQAAKWLGCSERTVYSLIRQGEIAAVRFGRSVRISEHALKEFVDRHERKVTT